MNGPVFLRTHNAPDVDEDTATVPELLRLAAEHRAAAMDAKHARKCAARDRRAILRAANILTAYEVGVCGDCLALASQHYKDAARSASETERFYNAAMVSVLMEAMDRCAR